MLSVTPHSRSEAIRAPGGIVDLSCSATAGVTSSTWSHRRARIQTGQSEKEITAKPTQAVRQGSRRRTGRVVATRPAETASRNVISQKYRSTMKIMR